jgi:acetolactate synthase-1/2/3 large subunit
MGAMGFSIPAAIGAACADTGKWIVIAGDGCAQLSIAELQTLKHYQLPVAVCVINNHQLGMVAQFQEENMDSRFVATRDGYSVPDFLKIADAFGIPSMRIDSLDHLDAAKDFVAYWTAGPILLEFVVPNDAKALPKLVQNSRLADL